MGSRVGNKTTFITFKKHLNSVCGIDLETHLEFLKKHTITNYSLATSILVLYRYAEKLGKKIQVRDAIAGGHKSHAALLTETDFDLLENAVNWKPKIQIELAGDLLVISDKAKKDLSAFRLGFYFDKFKEAKKEVGEKNTAGQKDYTKAKFLEVYGEEKAGASMHIGARYDFKKNEYLGKKIKKGVVFGLWGSGGTRDGTGDFWAEKIKEWKCSYLDDAKRDAVVKAFLADCKKLDTPYFYPEHNDRSCIDKRSLMYQYALKKRYGLMTTRVGVRIGTDPRSVASRKALRDGDEWNF